MTLLTDALIKVAQRIAESEKSTFELKQFVDAELERQKKAFPWMFSHDVLRLVSPQPEPVSVVSPPEVNMQINDSFTIPAGATIIPVKTTVGARNTMYLTFPEDFEIEDTEEVRDITDEEVRGYCYGNGYWINISEPKTLKEKEDGTHIVEDSYGNVYTMRPTWNCISLMVKGDEESNG